MTDPNHNDATKTPKGSAWFGSCLVFGIIAITIAMLVILIADRANR